MSSTKFIVTERIGILGRLRKETAEVGRAVVDFTCWLDPGEIIGLVSRFSLNVTDQFPVAVAWQADYPFDPTAQVEDIADSVPLVLTGSTIDNGNIVNVLLGAGTPGLTYIVSFIAVATTSGRERQINFLVTIPAMSNPAMISSLNPAQEVSFTTVAGTVSLPLGTIGTVFVENAASAPITITLPPSPVTGQGLRIVDAAGNASTHNIHIQGSGGVQILGMSEYILAVDNQAGVFEWDGTEWIVS